MRIWLTFCMFFVVAPIFISIFLRISQIIRGPVDNSRHQVEAYQKRLRKILIELGVLFIILIGIGGVLVEIWIRSG